MSNTKTIAKNTIFLYIRMLFNMAVALYTSRKILEVLGVEDFGIYNLVAGVVVLFSFLNNSMTAATQRYINVEKVIGGTEGVNKIFNISIINHILIAIIIFILSESIGWWFLNNKLNIPIGKESLANTVFQISILITMVDIVRIPFNSIIIAYERMSFYAWLGILEVILKLLVVFLLLFIPGTSTIVLYAILLLGLSVIVFFIYFSFCKKIFTIQTKFKFYKDFRKTKELFSFSGWILIGQMVGIGATQGLNMIINIFFGVVLNAAIGIANQVDGAINGFVGNFQTAFNPQIVQTYANKEYDKNKKMILATSKYSFFLMVLLAAPILLFTHNILVLWLGDNLPSYVEKLTQIIIFCSLLATMSGPFSMSISAIGMNATKAYTITLTTLNLFVLPLAYLFLKLGYSPVFVFIAKFIINIILQLLRIVFINYYLKFNKNELYGYLWNIGSIFILLPLIVYFSNSMVNISLLQMIVYILFLEMSLLSLVWIIGLNREERVYIINFFKKKYIK